MLVFNQKGLFFAGINDRQKCIRFMNEIIGTAILQGYNFDVITDLDIGETTITKNKGEKRNQTYPRSITRVLKNGKDTVVELAGVKYIIARQATKLTIDCITNFVLPLMPL